MRTKLGKYILLVVVLVWLAGCQTVPLYTVKPGFGEVPEPGKGRVRITVFHIPKDEPGVKLYRFLGALAGANTRVRYRASIYDVTDGVTYIGTISNDGYAEWLEYDAPAGQRILMLTQAGRKLFPADGDSPYTDFIKINVSADSVEQGAGVRHRSPCASTRSWKARVRCDCEEYSAGRIS